MTNLSGSERKRYVRDMFGNIAGRYDLMNRLMTGGMDIPLRNRAIKKLKVPPAASVLDAGAGTGDLSHAILKKQPDCKMVASDLTLEMVLVGKKRFPQENIHWVIADAQALPFKPQAFERVISGYLLRNVPDVPLTLAEQRRVLKDGGRVVSLDTSPPPDNWMKPFIDFYLNRVIPSLGRLIAGAAEAYTYLPESTAGFLKAEVLAETMQQAGFENVAFRRHLFGTMAVHAGDKAESSHVQNP